jgi:DNA-binding transcriptional regulator of glucitol operon
MTNISWVFIALALAWCLQLYLSFFQMRRFYGRVSELRRTYNGVTSIGMEGSAWKRRQYAVIVVDKDKRILAVEQLSGWTILAKLQPVKGLEGLTFEDLFDEARNLPVNRKLLLAMRDAAQHILKAEEHEKEEANAPAQDLDMEENAAV